MATIFETKLTANPGSLEMTIEREFDAPRELVFKAFTDPTLYALWIGPRRLTTRLDYFEAKNGGSWRFVQKDVDGNEYRFHGVYHEVKAPERIITTFEFEGLPESGHVCLETSTFVALPDDRTRVSSQTVFQSVEDRDGMLQAGMEEGMNESYERLDELLDKMQR